MTGAEQVWLGEVGMRVRVGRVVRRLSQDRLAELAGVSRVTLGSVERGEHQAGVLVYIRVARAIDVPVGELLAGAP